MRAHVIYITAIGERQLQTVESKSTTHAAIANLWLIKVPSGDETSQKCVGKIERGFGFTGKAVDEWFGYHIVQTLFPNFAPALLHYRLSFT